MRSALCAALALSACDAGSAVLGDSPSDPASSRGSNTAADAPEAPAAVVTTNVRSGARDVPVDTVLAVTVSNAQLKSVAVSAAGPDAGGTLAGDIAANGYSWRAGSRLEPGTSYVVRTVATGADGDQVRRTSRFQTQALSLDQQTFASVAPLDGETVGVGMPVIVTFDVPVSDHAAIEKHMAVTSTPSQAGTWHWMSDTEVHWRPKSYWKPGTKVSVDVDVNSVPAGDGIFGQESRTVDFEVGAAHVYQVNARTHQMTVRSNGKVLRTIPITTGKAGFTTRSGVKVIIEKFETKRMNSETVGIGQSNPEYYDIDDVKYAMRLTYSGEFIHAAPWSVGSQGYDNVSHGCTGMSTDNAAWLYAMSRRGDVVEYTGTDRPMTLDNGYGDWNESYWDYRAGSALA